MHYMQLLVCRIIRLNEKLFPSHLLIVIISARIANNSGLWQALRH